MKAKGNKNKNNKRKTPNKSKNKIRLTFCGERKKCIIFPSKPCMQNIQCTENEMHRRKKRRKRNMCKGKKKYCINFTQQHLTAHTSCTLHLSKTTLDPQSNDNEKRERERKRSTNVVWQTRKQELNLMNKYQITLSRFPLHTHTVLIHMELSVARFAITIWDSTQIHRDTGGQQSILLRSFRFALCDRCLRQNHDVQRLGVQRQSSLCLFTLFFVVGKLALPLD